MPVWIKCSERLPQPEIHKLIYCRKSDYGFVDGLLIGFYDSMNTRWVIKCGCTGYECDPDFPHVTHWAELPEEPKEL